MINPGLVLTSGFFFFLLFERYDKEEESHDCRVWTADILNLGG